MALHDLLGVHDQLASGLHRDVVMADFHRDPTVFAIIAAAMEVHRSLGPGLFERVYQTCLAYELSQRGLQLAREVGLPVTYKGLQMECGFRVDFLVNAEVIVEVKCVDYLLPIHTAQVLTYLKLTGARQALLINFNGVTLKEGLRSFLGEGNIRSR